MKKYLAMLIALSGCTEPQTIEKIVEIEVPAECPPPEVEESNYCLADDYEDLYGTFGDGVEAEGGCATIQGTEVRIFHISQNQMFDEDFDGYCENLTAEGFSDWQNPNWYQAQHAHHFANEIVPFYTGCLSAGQHPAFNNWWVTINVDHGDYETEYEITNTCLYGKVVCIRFGDIQDY